MNRNNENLNKTRDILKHIPRVELRGRNEIVVENHSGILMFDTDIVRLKTKIGTLNIYGEKFNLLFMNGPTLVIEGKFKSLEYEGED
ncbi:YabP/YqfC family sporulation protein [uncultured Clostridium sp.]|jgi:sporulation protein YqfC|uniref:YabP/YqfC family sporulation protein n=1 Tax=uncultured Clostridium sp. TaxID=59620 RepID=UPI002634A240|nr:YabP/YqfC family sporulation protein [uncultured Clostridium sp.]